MINSIKLLQECRFLTLSIEISAKIPRLNLQNGIATQMFQLRHCKNASVFKGFDQVRKGLSQFGVLCSS